MIVRGKTNGFIFFLLIACCSVTAQDTLDALKQEKTETSKKTVMSVLIPCAAALGLGALTVYALYTPMPDLSNVTIHAAHNSIQLPIVPSSTVDDILKSLKERSYFDRTVIESIRLKIGGGKKWYTSARTFYSRLEITENVQGIIKKYKSNNFWLFYVLKRDKTEACYQWLPITEASTKN